MSFVTEVMDPEGNTHLETTTVTEAATATAAMLLLPRHGLSFTRPQA